MADADKNFHLLIAHYPEARDARIAAEALLDAMDDGYFDLDLDAINHLNAPSISSKGEA